jgi:transcription initiation factor TFIIIB Brf1 subunit/transcription initiation factor TFIIB
MICPECNGRRVVWNPEWEEDMECVACGGVGEVDSDDYEED